MATYVLVHGAWSGGWGYTKTARIMRAAGHEVWVPTLTGLGERSHLASPGITLSIHIQDVVNVFDYEDLTDVILVGHSYGGMVITGVATKIGERIRTLVYLDAFIPGDGQALWDLANDVGHQTYMDGQRKTPGLVASIFASGSQDPEVAAVRRRKLDSQPLLTMMEPVNFTGKEALVGKRTYIYASGGERQGFTRFYNQVKDDPAWTVKTIGTGHIVMMEDPQGLADMLMEEA